MKWAFQNLKPVFRRPDLLLHPNIPKPLHGCAPRVVKGEEWWNQVRREAYAKNNHCCWACGASVAQGKGQRLDAHEVYDYDYPRGRLTFKEVVALCRSCHLYIHSGMTQHLIDEGELDPGKAEAIDRHGRRILKAAGMLGMPYISKDKMELGERLPWTRWRMIIDGKAYGPTSRSYEDWEAGEWRHWKP